MDNTIAYYNEHAAEFVDCSINADMTLHYGKFLQFVPLHGKLLDLGCGSGRDTKYFLSKGYDVTAVDGSEELCKMASAYAGIAVRNLLFQDLDYENEFDGVWACASLLHVSKDELPTVLKKIAKALKKDGVLYVSFKYGTEEREKDGRSFSDFTPESLSALMDKQPSLHVIDTWVTTDVRPDRENEKWVSSIAKIRPYKKGEPLCNT